MQLKNIKFLALHSTKVLQLSQTTLNNLYYFITLEFLTPDKALHNAKNKLFI